VEAAQTKAISVKGLAIPPGWLIGLAFIYRVFGCNIELGAFEPFDLQARASGNRPVLL